MARRSCRMINVGDWWDKITLGPEGSQVLPAACSVCAREAETNVVLKMSGPRVYNER